MTALGKSVENWTEDDHADYEAWCEEMYASLPEDSGIDADVEFWE